MKKFFIALLAVILLMMVSLTALAEESMLVSFEDVSDPAVYLGSNEQGLFDYFDVEKPQYETVQGDSGNGIRVTCGSQAAWVQDFLIRNEDALAGFHAAADSKKYIRIYVVNEFENSDISMTFIIRGDGDLLSFANPNEMIMMDTEGYEIDILCDDASFIGHAEGYESSIVIPVDFEGYIYIPLDLSFFLASSGNDWSWVKGSVGTLGEINTLEFDFRTKFMDDSGSYILDSIAVVDAPENDTPPTQEPDNTQEVTEQPTGDASITPTETTESPQGKILGMSTEVFIIVIVALLVVVGASIAVVVSKKRKKE